MLAGRLLERQILQVVGQDDGGGPPFTQRNADGPVDQMADLRRRRGLFDEGAGDILHQALEIDFLLVVASEGGAGLLAADGQHRLVVEAGVVEAGDQVRGARAGGGDADPELAAELRVSRGHEGGHLLVARLDELDLALGAVQGAEHAVDAVAGVAVDPPHTPGVEPLDHEITDGLGHLSTPWAGARPPPWSRECPRGNRRPRPQFPAGRARSHPVWR